MSAATITRLGFCMIRYRTVAGALLLAAGACVNGPVDPPAQPKPAACAREAALFDLAAMRDAVKEAMAYPFGGGVSADMVFDALEDRAAAARTETEHLRVLEAFVYAMGDHHAHLSTNDAMSPRLVPTGASVWVEGRGGKLVVSQVRPAGSGLAIRRAGLREGMVIERIDGVSVAEALKPPPADADKADAMLGFAGRVVLAGTRRHEPTITVRGAGEREFDVPIPAAANEHAELARLSFPAPGVAVIRLENSIGDSALNPVFDGLMKQAKGARAVILDLRNTPSGGNTDVAKPLMAWFVDGTRSYQTHESRDRRWTEQVTGRPDRFKGRLVVLVDHWTGSMGEGAAIGLRAAAGAKVVGTSMAGLRGAIDGFDVPCLGVSFRFPIERLYEVGGAPRELARPDVVVNEEELAAAGNGDDVMLDRAIALAVAP